MRSILTFALSAALLLHACTISSVDAGEFAFFCPKAHISREAHTQKDRLFSNIFKRKKTNNPIKETEIVDLNSRPCDLRSAQNNEQITPTKADTRESALFRTALQVLWTGVIIMIGFVYEEELTILAHHTLDHTALIFHIIGHTYSSALRIFFYMKGLRSLIWNWKDDEIFLRQDIFGFAALCLALLPLSWPVIILTVPYLYLEAQWSTEDQLLEVKKAREDFWSKLGTIKFSAHLLTIACYIAFLLIVHEVFLWGIWPDTTMIRIKVPEKYWKGRWLAQKLLDRHIRIEFK